MNSNIESPDPRIDYFDKLAVNWDNQEPSQDTMVARMLENAELMAIKPGDDILEVGCGTGKTTGYLAEKASPGRVRAIDFAGEMIRKASEKGIDAEFACVDVCSDDLGEKLYDIVLCFHCFPHLRDQLGALKRFERSLKDGGRLIVMHIASRDHINGIHASLSGAVHGDMLPAEDQWPALLSEAGLEQVKLIDHDKLFFLEAVSKLNSLL